MTQGPTEEQLVEITSDVWRSFAGSTVEPVEEPSALPGDRVLRGRVDISGGWRGSVLLDCPFETARAAAAAMYGIPGDGLTEPDIADAIGELANMVGGSVKSLLPGPSRLSLPVVTVVTRGDAGVGRPLRRIGVNAGGSTIGIEVWELAP